MNLLVNAAALALLIAGIAPVAAQQCSDDTTQELAGLSGELAEAPRVDTRVAGARVRELATVSPPACEKALRAAFARLRLTADHDGESDITEGLSIAKALRSYSDFSFQPGDVILMLRDAAPISIAVSQIAEQPGFFSHAAIVGYRQDKKKLYVIETSLGSGLTIEPLKDWTDNRFARFAVYRHRDPELAQKAGIAAYLDAASRDDTSREYDLAMSLHDGSRLYCSEVVSHAYALAAPDAPMVPRYLSSVGSLIDTFPMSTLGATEQKVFLPDDIELDARFEPVIELRVSTLIAKAEPLQRIVRKLYDGLRGPQREQILADIDRQESGATKALGSLFGGHYPLFTQLPKSAMPRLTGFGRLVAAELEREQQPATP